MRTTTTRQRRSADELIDARFVKAIAHPLRVRIMVELDRGPMSPVEYAAKFGESLDTVAYHFRILMECDCIEIVGTRERRGATEHFYENSQRALFSEEEFAQLPMAVKGSFSASILSTFMDVAAEALLTGKLDSFDGRHLTWKRHRLDKQGFDEVMGKLDELFFELLPAATVAAEERMEESGESPIVTAVGLFAFECPEPERDHDLTPQ